MSAEVANSTNNEIYFTEPKIYVSKATLQLKCNVKDYTWRTEVITPQQTTATTPPPVVEGVTETEVAKKHVNEANSGISSSSSSAGGAATTTAAVVTAATTAAAATALHHHKPLPTFTPATKPIKIVKAVSDFMHSERCHTENIENMNQFVSRL